MTGVTLEALVDGVWLRAATVELPDEAAGEGGRCYFEYEYDYLERWLDSRRFDVAASVTLPLEFGPTSLRRWPAFLDDLRPMGSARRWWLRHLNLPESPASDFTLLKRGTVAPVGNLRVAEALPVKAEPPRRFSSQSVVDREQDFLAWRQSTARRWAARRAPVETRPSCSFAATPTHRCGSTSGRTSRRTPRRTCW